MNWFQKSLRTGTLLIILGSILACGNKNKTEASEFFERGNFHFKKNETERALELFTEAIEKVPDFADAYNNRGLCFEKLGNIEKARNDYRKAVELDDTFSQAKLNLAAAQINLGELKESEQILQNLAPSYADSSKFYDLRGKYYIQAYNPDAAINDFQKSLELSPFNFETLTNLGYAFYQKRDFENAKEAFISVISEQPDFAFALNNLSATFAQLADWDEALVYSQKAIKLQANEVTFINTHALNLLENNKVKDAAAFVEQALKLQPDNAYSLRNSAILDIKTENLSKAKTILTSVEKSNPEVEFLYYYLGILEDKMGNKSAACSFFKRGALLGDLRSENEYKRCP